ncbi:hypothetical protein KY361_07805, partial [Candidatus Woesearchaeota archaeon]|nr:hypothetical protein [Candidatus Woesearchaeota archaeon]
MKKTALLLFLVLLLIVNVAFAAPIVNEWLAPFDSTPVYLKGVQNVQVNVTDTANPINAVLLDINGTNLSMSQNGDIWSYPWNTDIYSEGVYNFNLFANNSIGENTTSTLSDIYVDRTIPAIFNAISGANPRDYVAAGAGFNALVDTTDLSPIKNVTCVLDGSIVEAVFVAGNQYSCALTAPTAENDYTITFNSEDTVGNINTTTADFTTRITTAAQISANAIVISDLNQSDKEGVLITARLTNNGNSPMHDSVVEIDPIESSIGTSTVYVKPCNKTKLDAGQYCDIIFNLTINGGVPPKDYIVFWTANWTDNNFDTQTRTPYDESIITVLSNPIVEVQDNLSLSVSHGTNATQQIGINSTGNDNLSNIGISYTQISLPSSWVNIQSSLNNIPGGSSGLFDLTIVVPEFAYPGTYAGRLTISATGATTEYIDLFVEVVEDNSWTVSPINIDAYVKSGTTGLVGTYSVNNSGNIDQNYNMSYNGTLYNYIMDDALTPTSLNVPRNSVRTFSIYIDKTVPYNSYLLNIDVAGKNSVHKFNTMNLYVDDNAPSITITNPANNAEVSGLVEINTTATDLMLQGIVFEINPVGLCNNGSTQSGITTGISLNDSYVWDPSGFCDAQYTIKAT